MRLNRFLALKLSLKSSGFREIHIKLQDFIANFTNKISAQNRIKLAMIP